jgi:hypothetical protein
MRRAIGTTAMAVMVAAGISLSAQKTTQVHPGKGGSPHVKTEWTVDGANISISYGRPSLKGREEAKLMPPGKEWRTGADEATTLTTDKNLMFGSVHLTPGSYTLYTVPGATEWQLVISKKTGQWGVPYPGAGEDLGRAPMKVTKNASPVEQLTIDVTDTQAGGELSVSWGTQKATIPFMVH